MCLDLPILLAEKHTYAAREQARGMWHLNAEKDTAAAASSLLQLKRLVQRAQKVCRKYKYHV